MIDFQKTIILLSSFSLMTVACSSMSDQFSYTNGKDEFTGQTKSHAEAEVRGDEEPEVKITVGLTCSYKDTPDPINDLKINLFTTDSKGDPKELRSLSIKFDNEEPESYQSLKEFDQSTYGNELEITWTSALIAKFSIDDRYKVRRAIASGHDMKMFYADHVKSDLDAFNSSDYTVMEGIDLNDARKHLITTLDEKSSNSKTLLVRFESTAGLVNTAKFDLTSSNFRKVLKDCGWKLAQDASDQKPSEPAAKTNVSFTQQFLVGGWAMEGTACDSGQGMRFNADNSWGTEGGGGKWSIMGNVVRLDDQINGPSVWQVEKIDNDHFLVKYKSGETSKFTRCPNIITSETGNITSEEESNAEGVLTKGSCKLNVNGTSYINGECYIEFVDKEGSFYIFQNQNRKGYFAALLRDGPTGNGYWNGSPDSTHAHDELGQLKRNGGCWINDKSSICAYEI